MSFATDMVKGNTVSFQLYPNGVITPVYSNAQVLSIWDVDDAKGLIDPYALHLNIHSQLPPGTPKDPTNLTFYKLKLANGEITALCQAWIQESTVQVQTMSTIQFTVANCTPDDIRHILDALSSVGKTAVNTKVLT
jgi:hypothetical protein